MQTKTLDIDYQTNRFVIMRKYLLFFFILLCCLPLSGQITKQDVLSDRRQTGGSYHCYPGPLSVQTAAPEGYTPFYVSHFGRHGSRYMLSSQHYDIAIYTLQKADSLQILSEHGKSVLGRLKTAFDDANGHDGDLTRLGGRQHQDIGRRMAKNYPEAFGNGSTVNAISSTVQRCVVSMANFLMAFHEEAPKADIFMESSKKHMWWLAASRELIPKVHQDTIMQQKAAEFELQLYNPKRLMSTLFTVPSFPQSQSNQRELMLALYNIASDMQSLPELNIDFYDVFTDDELFSLWQTDNIGWCLSEGFLLDCAPRYQVHLPLLRDIVDKAQNAIDSDRTGADLRFGHDASLVPLGYLLGLEGFRPNPYDLKDLWESFASYRVTPMGANIQFVFYKRADKGDILIKVLHNENETHLPIPTQQWPYYKWTEVKEYIQSILDSQ